MGCARLPWATLLEPNPPRCNWTSPAASRWTTTPSRSSWRPSSRTASTSIRKATSCCSARKRTRAPSSWPTRNDKLFADGAGSGAARQAGALRHRRQRRGRQDLPRDRPAEATWVNDPWTALDEAEHPDKWDDRFAHPRLPEEADKPRRRWGPLAQRPVAEAPQHSPLPAAPRGQKPTFMDRDLFILARAEMKAQEWAARTRIQEAA